jgi:hypothetical protein
MHRRVAFLVDPQALLHGVALVPDVYVESREPGRPREREAMTHWVETRAI